MSESAAYPAAYPSQAAYQAVCPSQWCIRRRIRVRGVSESAAYQAVYRHRPPVCHCPRVHASCPNTGRYCEMTRIRLGHDSDMTRMNRAGMPGAQATGYARGRRRWRGRWRGRCGTGAAWRRWTSSVRPCWGAGGGREGACSGGAAGGEGGKCESCYAGSAVRPVSHRVVSHGVTPGQLFDPIQCVGGGGGEA